MPINIDELHVSNSRDEPRDDLAQRVLELESRFHQLAIGYRDLSLYCQNLEEACREAFAECPGHKPFAMIFRP